MKTLPPYRRILLLTEGHLGVFSSKTASSLLRYRGGDVAAVIDSAFAGQPVRRHIPWAPEVPILPSIESAAPLRPDALFIGIAPVGGSLPAAMHAHVSAALRAGIDVVSGLHTRIAADPILSAAARGSGARIHDVREPPTGTPVAACRARSTRCRRVLTVGSDCNVGKMVAALELTAAARRRGLDARFAATGQTGIMIAGVGVAVDAVVSDFAAGAIEALVLELGDCDLLLIEGQGSIAHPGYSGVTLSLLHGACPDALVLVHHVGRERYSHEPHTPLPTLSTLRAAYEQTAALLHPAPVVAAALNGHGAAQGALEAEAARIAHDLGVPAADATTEGVERLLDAILRGVGT